MSEAEAPAGGDALALMVWLSPAFPVGAYAYSHGLEWAVEAGDIRDEAGLLAWLRDLLHLGFVRTEAILFRHAHAAAAAGDAAGLVAVNDLALALAPAAELRLETGQQGRSFLDAVAAGWPAPQLAPLAQALAPEAAYPVAVGLACAVHRLAAEGCVPPLLLAQMQNLVSAAVRLAPIGQTAGLRVLAALMPELREVAAGSRGLSLDAIGSATFRADLGSFHHETQYSRLFRS